MIHSLRLHEFSRLVVVLGHQAECIRDFLGAKSGGMEITYINSPLYKTTNNIYSLWLARKAIEESFLLIESDLVFDALMPKSMLRPDRIALARPQSWMHGATVTIDRRQQVEAFWCGSLGPPGAGHYKTVNIYSLSHISWQLVRERLEQHISDNRVDGYYETVFAEMVAEGSLRLTPVFFEANRWYEIDTMDDLRAAEQMFPQYPQVGVAGGIKLPDLQAAGSRLLREYRPNEKLH